MKTPPANRSVAGRALSQQLAQQAFPGRVVVLALPRPHPFHAIGLHYVDFHQLGDDEVLAALESAHVPQ